MSIQQLDNIMKQLALSNKPDDIATLAYVWGFPLVNMIRTADFTTGRGPENTFNHLVQGSKISKTFCYVRKIRRYNGDLVGLINGLFKLKIARKNRANNYDHIVCKAFSLWF